MSQSVTAKIEPGSFLRNKNIGGSKLNWKIAKIQFIDKETTKDINICELTCLPEIEIETKVEYLDANDKRHEDILKHTQKNMVYPQNNRFFRLKKEESNG